MLGITLYELLTLEPAFSGTDREELLRQIALDEPVPPRRLNQAIPHELETIVLKAAAKDAEGRYLTAQALADDLRRFVENKPIQARRPSMVDRGRKWVRRHQAAVATAVVLLMMAVAALSVTAVVIANQREEAIRQREEAIRQRQQTRQAMRELTVGLEAWVSQPGGPEVHPQFVQVQRFYAELEAAPENLGDVDVQYEIAQIHHLIGELHARRQEKSAAVVSFEKAIALLDKLAQEFPAVPRYRRELAVCYQALGDFSGTVEQKKKSLETAIQLFERVVADDAKDRACRYRLASTHSRLAFMSQLPWDDPEKRKKTEQHYNRAIELGQKLVDEFPDEFAYRTVLTHTYTSAALFFASTNRPTAAAEVRRKADELNGMVSAKQSPPSAESQQATAKRPPAIKRLDSAKPGLAQFNLQPTIPRPIFDMNSIIDLAQAPPVLDYLKVTAGESAEIAKWVKELRAKEDAEFTELWQLSNREKLFREPAWFREAPARRKPTEERIKAILGDERFARLREIRWQMIGLNGLHGVVLQKELGMTRAQILALMNDLGPFQGFPWPPGVLWQPVIYSHAQMSKPNYEEVFQREEAKNQRVLPWLTPEQQERWRKLCGEPIDAATKRAIYEAVDNLY